MKKFIRIIFILFFVYNSALSAELRHITASEEITTKGIEIEASIKSFEEQCLDDKGNILIGKLNPDTFVKCEVDAQFLVNEMSSYQESLNEEAEVLKEAGCKARAEAGDLEKLADAATLAASHIECQKDRLKSQKTNCGSEFMCFAARSVVGLTTGLNPLIPKSLSNKLKRSSNKFVGKFVGGCDQNETSDCMDSLVKNLVASLIGTANAFIDLAVDGVKALFDIGGWFSSKAEKAHDAAQEDVESVKSFLSNPFDWVLDKLNNIKAAADQWVKKTVLCQQWSGEPHLSTCTVPLYSFDCIDCNTAFNATCAAIGAIVSEVGIGILTGGASTAISITSRATMISLRAAAKKAASKISIKSPMLAMRAASKTSVAAKGLFTAFRVSAATSAKMKDKIQTMKDLIAKAKKTKTVVTVVAAAESTGRAATKVLEVVADPTSIVGKVNEKVSEGVTKVMTKSNGKIGEVAIEDYHSGVLAKKSMAAGSKDGKELMRKHKSKTKPSKVRATVAMNKIRKKASKKDHLGLGEESRPSEFFEKSKNSSNDSDLKLQKDRSSSEIAEVKKPENKTEITKPESKSEKPANKTAEHKNHHENDEQTDVRLMGEFATGLITGSNKMITGVGKGSVVGNIVGATKNAAILNKVVEENLDYAKLAEKEKGNELDYFVDKSQQSRRKGSEASVNNLENQKKSNQSKEAKQVKTKSSNQMNKSSSSNISSIISHIGDDITNDEQLVSRLGISGSDNLKTQRGIQAAKRKVNTLSNLYNERNRNKVVQKMMQSNESLSIAQANQIFDKRKREVISAKSYIDSKDMGQINPNQQISRTSALNRIKELENAIAKEDQKNTTNVDRSTNNASGASSVVNSARSRSNAGTSSKSNIVAVKKRPSASAGQSGATPSAVVFNAPSYESNEDTIEESLNKALLNAYDKGDSNDTPTKLNTQDDLPIESKIEVKRSIASVDKPEIIEEETLYSEFQNLFGMKMKPMEPIENRDISELPEKLQSESPELIKKLREVKKDSNLIDKTTIYQSENGEEIHKLNIKQEEFYLLKSGSQFKLISEQNALNRLY